MARGDDKFAEIGERYAGGAIAEGAGGLDGGADLGGADGAGAGQENESGSREKTLGHDKYPARGLKTVRNGAAAPSRGTRADRFMRRLFEGVVTVLRQFREIVDAKMRCAEPFSPVPQAHSALSI